jgi:NADH:ubiquinone oxidoreductase subunit 5 (subunit L)/multisubunit Na+/H+ antiporter MnhA subunit
VVLRTGERLMYRMGGLIKNMPFTFVATMIAIIAMSGVPPLTGFGGKWLLFNAMMDKGWYWLAALAFFSSAVAFLYMYRILHTVFLGQRKLAHARLREAPAILLVPQFVLIGIIMLPLSDAVGSWLGGGLIWDGLSLQTHLGYWNAPMIMGIIAVVWMTPLVILLLASLTMKIQKVEQFNIVYAAERPHRPEDTHFAYNFFAHYDRALGFLVRPRANAFWSAVAEWSHSLAATMRVFYNGNGQTYALFILMFLVALYLVNGGLRW